MKNEPDKASHCKERPRRRVRILTKHPGKVDKGGGEHEHRQRDDPAGGPEPTTPQERNRHQSDPEKSRNRPRRRFRRTKNPEARSDTQELEWAVKQRVVLVDLSAKRIPCKLRVHALVMVHGAVTDVVEPRYECRDDKNEDKERLSIVQSILPRLPQPVQHVGTNRWIVVRDDE